MSSTVPISGCRVLLNSMTHSVKQALRSGEVVVLAAGSYFPINLVRVATVRLAGARLGRGIAIHHGLQCRSARRLAVGDDVFVGEHVVLDGRGGLTIGSHVSINSEAQIWTAQHDWRAPGFPYVATSLSIGDFAWISARTIILPGVAVGEGAVVAAGAVVTKDVGAWTLVAGNPARVISDRPRLPPYELRARSNKIWWW